jgi:mannose-6-phosphate isomerase-like protein (cupin superfamily)
MPPTQPLVLRRGDGRHLWWLGQRAIYLLTGSDTANTCALAWGTVPPGAGPPPHLHHREDEAFYLLSGELAFTAGNQTLTLREGDFFNVCKETAHFFKNPGPAAAEVLVLVTPPFFDLFQFEAGESLDPSATPRPVTPADVQRMFAVAPKYGIDMNPPAEAFQTAPRIKHVPRGGGRVVSVVGDVYTFLMTGDETDGKCALFEFLILPGNGPPPHVHHREEEMFYVLEGEIAFFVAGRKETLTTGDMLLAPRDIPHHFRNEGGVPVRMLCLVMPAGLDRFFAEVGLPMEKASDAPPPFTEADLGRLLAVAPKYGLEIFGPG